MACPVHANTTGERPLTELDHARLTHLGGKHLLPALAEMLDSTELATSRAVPPEVVIMYSQVLPEELAPRKQHKLTLCYPGNAEPHHGFISVLSPEGSRLLGLRAGAIARSLPSGQCLHDGNCGVAVPA